MTNKDWAHEVAVNIVQDYFKTHREYSYLGSIHYGDLVVSIARFLREAHKIEWPNSPNTHKAMLVSFASSGHGDVACYDKGFRDCKSWLKQWVESRRG